MGTMQLNKEIEIKHATDTLVVGGGNAGICL